MGGAAGVIYGWGCWGDIWVGLLGLYMGGAAGVIYGWGCWGDIWVGLLG